MATATAVNAQTVLLAWDEAPVAGMLGYAVTVDGVRTDYGLSPARPDGSCGCTVAATFLGARRTVTVSAYNATGETVSARFIVGPTASAGGPYSGRAGTSVNVTAAGSTDNASSIVKYVWSWGDGSSNTSTSSSAASHVYANDGVYTIALNVTDGDGATSTATTTASVAAAALQAPGAPASPSPTVGATGVQTTTALMWTAVGATSYDLNFGSSNPPARVASALSQPMYSPSGLAASTTYWWQVTARNAAGATAGPVWSFRTSDPVPATAALPLPWKAADIGAVDVAGSASFSNGVFSVRGAGNIGGTVDAFRYVSQPITGDGQIVARVATIQNTSAYARSGVMIRESAAAGAAHATIDVRPNGTIEFVTRRSTGAATKLMATATQPAPAWLKLSRAGARITAAVSADGVTWTTIGSTTLSIPAVASFGLAVSAHVVSTLNASTFTNVSVIPSSGGQ